MKLTSLIRNILNQEIDINPPIKTTDSFADTLAIDFKRAASDAIYQELQKVEARYLSATLKQSYFPIESISFHPIGHSTAIELEEFFRLHSEIDPSFETEFFKTILLKEYKTKHGALALLQPNLIPVIQPNESSLDNPTADEAYQISLRGNVKRLSATVRLGNPKQRGIKDPEVANIKEPRKTNQANIDNLFGRSSSIPINKISKLSSSESQETSLAVQISDANGISNLIINTPFIIGRSTPEISDTGLQKTNIDGMYVSRKQLVVFQLGGSVYAFIPSDATLCAIINPSQIIEHMQLIEITTTAQEIIFGQPPGTKEIAVDKLHPQLYPSILIRKVNSSDTSRLESTPIPGIIK